MITAARGTPLYYFCGIVDSLKPGQAYAFDCRELHDICSYEYNGAWFNPPDRILGNIVGSAYTHSYEERGGEVIFYRHTDTGKVHFRDPDRRG